MSDLNSRLFQLKKWKCGLEAIPSLHFCIPVYGHISALLSFGYVVSSHSKFTGSAGNSSLTPEPSVLRAVELLKAAEHLECSFMCCV